jgi:DNA processing protein
MALLGCGTDVVYPPQNKRLMSDIIENGCVISQFPMGARPNGRNFPIRNRVISGLSMGVLIVEAPLRSGAMITARQAAEQGREFFAIPVPIVQQNSKGPHALIREGAILTDSVDDILLELDLPRGVRRQVRCEAAVPAPSDPPAPPSRRTPKEQPPAQPHEAAQPIPPRPAESVPFPTDNRERTVLAALSHEGSYVDEIADRCGISVAEALGALTILELKGLVRQFSGKRFAPR